MKFIFFYSFICFVFELDGWVSFLSPPEIVACPVSLGPGRSSKTTLRRTETLFLRNFTSNDSVRNLVKIPESRQRSLPGFFSKVVRVCKRSFVRDKTFVLSTDSGACAFRYSWLSNIFRDPPHNSLVHWNQECLRCSLPCRYCT